MKRTSSQLSFKEFCLLVGVNILKNTSEWLLLKVVVQNIYPKLFSSHVISNNLFKFLEGS